MQRTLMTVCLALAFGASACDDAPTDDGDTDSTDGDTTGGDGDGDAGLSHATDIDPILQANCVTCHAPGGQAEFLDYSTDSFAAIVGVGSTGAVGVNLVEPGDSANSYLLAKLRGTQVDLGGTGAQMPFGLDPLAEADLALIEQWIDEGAAP